MKRTILFLMFITVIMTISAQEEKKIVILHTNDLHSRLYGFAPESAYSPAQTGNDNTKGGFSRIASIMKDEIGKNAASTITIDAGDFLMGTLFHALEVKTGFQLQLMKKMGYDLVCLGNHEFDFGPGKLAEILSQSAKGGEIPAVLLGNAVFSDEDPGDDALEELFLANLLSRKLIIDRDGLKIGIFSLMGKDAADVAPRSKPVNFSKQTSFARKMVKELHGEGCDIIICVSHSGVSKDKDGRWAGEDVELAESVAGINVIISGHTHTKLEKPIIINGIPIVQTGEYGMNVGRLTMLWSDGKLSFDDYKLISVDDNINGDSNIDKMIEDQQNLVTQELLSPLGLKYFEPVAETDFELECNEQGDFKSSNLGPLVADAIHTYVNKHSTAGCDISMVAVGVIRDKIIPGILSAPDVFRIMSLGSGEDNIPGYPLARLYVTGRELKNIMEILQVAYKSSPSNYCFYSGFSVKYNPAKGLLRKIKKIEIVHPDGTVKPVDFSKSNKSLYSLAANSYMLDFIGIIKKMSFGLINVVPKDASGYPVTDMKNAVIDVNEELQGVQEGKEWLALLEYIGSMKDTDNDGIPDIDKKYSVPVQTFVTVKK
jgi:5'-nucleotidase / UDP-sugar diphosphatase